MNSLEEGGRCQDVLLVLERKPSRLGHVDANPDAPEVQAPIVDRHWAQDLRGQVLRSSDGAVPEGVLPDDSGVAEIAKLDLKLKCHLVFFI